MDLSHPFLRQSLTVLQILEVIFLLLAQSSLFTLQLVLQLRSVRFSQMRVLPGAFLVFLLDLQRPPFLLLSRLERFSLPPEINPVLPRSNAGHGKDQKKSDHHTD
jgi:hypothetical protein